MHYIHASLGVQNYTHARNATQVQLHAALPHHESRGSVQTPAQPMIQVHQNPGNVLQQVCVFWYAVEMGMHNVHMGTQLDSPTTQPSPQQWYQPVWSMHLIQQRPPPLCNATHARGNKRALLPHPIRSSHTAPTMHMGPAPPTAPTIHMAGMVAACMAAAAHMAVAHMGAACTEAACTAVACTATTCTAAACIDHMVVVACMGVAHTVVGITGVAA